MLLLSGSLLTLALTAACDHPPPANRVVVGEQRGEERPSTSEVAFVPLEGNAVNKSPQEVLRHALRFVDVATDIGVDHIYLNGVSEKRLMVEATGGGCGWIDFDRDGRCDLFVNQGGVPDAAPGQQRPPDRLLRQRSNGMFVDVSAAAAILESGYGQGLAVGDFDADGFDDIYVTNVGHNALLRNQGDGTYVDVTQQSQVGDEGWSSSAAWADLDLDGDLDLYVCHYVQYDPYDPVECLTKEGVRAICHPRMMDPSPDECFENLGDGLFRPVAKDWGLFGPGSKALGVAIADLTGDRRPDIYVANDTTANFVFVNVGPQQFVESAARLGGAYSMTGQPQASMGVGVYDYDGNGFLDVYLTHFTGEYNTLYRNQGAQGLEDVSSVTGMRELTWTKLGFGTVMTDFNLDGRPDIFVTNGHIDPDSSDGDGFEMSPQLFSLLNGRWQDQSAAAGPFFAGHYVGRGAATADFDCDGDLDLVVAHQNTPTAVLRNDSERGHWLKLQFCGVASDRNAVNTRVEVEAGGRRLVQELVGGTSYAAAHQRTLLFGLGDHAAACRVTVLWASGRVQQLADVGTDQSLIIVEGGSTLRDPALAE